MKESTALTRHFAHQGLKIKLRAGSTAATIGKTKRETSVSTPIRQPESPAERTPSRMQEPEGFAGPSRIGQYSSSSDALFASSLYLASLLTSLLVDLDPEPRASVPSGLAGPSVPFPDLPPYAGPTTSGARVQLPSIGDLAAFSLRPSYSSSTTLPPPHHPGRPPHALTPWQGSSGHPLSPTHNGPLPSPTSFQSAIDDRHMRDVPSSRELAYGRHSYSSSFPHPYAGGGGAVYTGPHSLPEHGRYDGNGRGSSPYPQWRDREWPHGGDRPASSADRDRHDSVSDALTPHRRSEASSSSSDGSRPPPLRSPSSGSGSGANSGRDEYRQQADHPRYGSRDGSTYADARPSPLALHSSHPPSDYPDRPNSFYSGPDRDRAQYASQERSPQSHWQHDYVPGADSHPAPHPHPHPHPHSHPLYHGYQPSYDRNSVPMTLPPLSYSSSTPSSQSARDASSSSRGMHGLHYVASPFASRPEPSTAQSSPGLDEHGQFAPASGASMASRPKKMHSSVRGGLDAHGYSHRPDEPGHPWNGNRGDHPYPYPSQPQHQYFPRGGGDLGATGRRRSGSPDWKEPLPRDVNMSGPGDRGPDGRSLSEAEPGGRSQ